MVEKIIHQIWVGDFKIPMREQNLMENLKNLHPDYQYILWAEPPTDFPNHMKEWYNKFYAIKNYAFCADLLRIWVVYSQGGFYLDIDFDIQKKLDPFFEKDGVFFYHNDTDFTIPNNIFSAKQGSDILKFCIDKVREDWSWYGPSWLGISVKKYFNLPNETNQDIVKEKLREMGIEYYVYWDFERFYGRHLSLYSWSPEVWNRLNNNEQL